jgi:hypothetical protein
MSIKQLYTNLTSLFLLAIPLAGWGFGSKVSEIADDYPDTIPAGFFNKWYLHYNPEQYLEHNYDNTLAQLETVGDFSLPDRYVFSFIGYSNLWNSYYYDGHCMDDLFFTGSPLHQVQLYNHDLLLDPANAQIQFKPVKVQDHRLGLQFNHGGIGGKAPFVDDMVRWFHSSAEERMLVPINNRRKIRNAVSAFGVYPIKGKQDNFDQHFHFYAGSRMITGFDYKGPADYYPENYLLFHHGGRIPVISEKLFDHNGYLFSFTSRDHLFAEQYFGRNETAKLTTTALSVYGKKEVKTMLYNAGINFSHKNIKPNDPGFERNLLDYDGEGLDPWYPGMNFFEWSVHFNYRKKFNRNYGFAFDLFDGVGIFRPDENAFHNYIYYQSNDTNRVNLYRLDWSSSPFTAGLLRNNAMLIYNGVSKNNRFTADLKAGLTLQGFLFSELSVVKMNVEAHLLLGYRFTRFFTLRVSTGRKPVPFNFEQVRFLSSDYLSGEIYFWNNDNRFYSNTGGASHSIAENIAQPSVFYLDVPLLFNIGQYNRIILTGQYRLFNDLWTVKYDKDPSHYGQFEEIDGEQVFFLSPGEIHYVVDNSNKTLMQEATGNSGILFSQPFYAGSTLRFSRESKKLYFSASVTAYMVVGSGALGNGFLHNNIGLLSESMANPNNNLNSLGRLDTDRSYLGKLIVSWALHPDFTLAFEFSYRDGQPISNFGLETQETDDGYISAIWRKKLPGDNPFTGEMGAREDGFFNSDLRARYILPLSEQSRLAFTLSIYNIYDFGTALSEFVFPPVRDNGRYVLDIGIPRGLIFTCEWMF